MIRLTKNTSGIAVTNRASASTRKRIIGASIKLFNKHGVRNVTTQQIATATGISASNLTYHFKRKNDLMLSMLAVLEEHMREALTPPDIGKNSRYRGENMAKILLTLWDFRFFFNALAFLLPNDKRLNEAYYRFQAWSIDTLDKGFQELVRRGDFSPVAAPNSTRLLAENTWVLWLGWLHMQEILGHTTRDKEQALYQCALHHWSLLAPHFSNAQDAKSLPPIYREIFLKQEAASSGKGDAA